MELKRYTIKALLIVMFGAQITSWAQQDLHARKKNLKAADDAFEVLDFLKAFNLYKDVIKYDTSNYDAIFKSGYCLLGMNKSDSTCLEYFSKAKSSVPESHFFMGKVFLLQGKPKKALEEFYFFKPVNTESLVTKQDVSQLINTCEEAIKEEERKQDFVVRNLGEKINTAFPEYVPLIWNLNGSLVFTSRRSDSKGGAKDPYGKFYEDIYTAQKNEKGWANPVSISDNINTSAHDACVAFSPSGNELIIYRTDASQIGGDLFLSKYEDGKWTTPEKLGPEINSEYLEASACFSSSGNEIIFSSNRPGGFGGKDLYITRKFMNGKYSLPRNLGPGINTAEDEDAPFVEKNTEALYFSSKGHNSIGEYDIFRSEFNNENESWGKAQNLGMPINSTNDDIYFTKPDDRNDYALFTSRRSGGLGDADIYEVDLNESAHSVVYCMLNIDKISDKKSLKDLQLSLYDNETGKLEGLYRPNKDYFSMILYVKLNKNYKMILDATGIEPIVNKVIFTGNEKEMTIQLTQKNN